MIYQTDKIKDAFFCLIVHANNNPLQSDTIGKSWLNDYVSGPEDPLLSRKMS